MDNVITAEQPRSELSDFYGSSRLGMNTKKADMLFPVSENVLSSYTGEKLYEMSNHLGNVLTVINDIKVPYQNDEDILYYATIVSTTDYSPFGVTLDTDGGRTQYLNLNENKYRFRFQGQEMDDEIKGDGNSVNYTYRMHDPRLGRFFAIDPLAPEYPWYSPYSFSGNKVIAWGELEGLEEYYAANGTYLGIIGTSTQLKIVNDKIIEIKGGIDNVKQNLIEIDKGINANSVRATKYKSWYDDNSTDVYREKHLYNFLKNWGKEYTPKSMEQEWGCNLFSKTLVDGLGNEFTAFVAGKTETSGLRTAIDPILSQAKVNEQQLILGKGNADNWKPYAIIHTHPAGGDDRKKFSWDDYAILLDHNAKGYLFAYGSNHMKKFYPKVYNSDTPYKWEPGKYTTVSEAVFDKRSIWKATQTTFNILEDE